MDLDEAVTELYGLHPDAFLEHRRKLTADAKAAKDTGLAKAVESVRKPTAAAWAVNQLARRRPEEVARLVELATALHAAQEKMDGAALKTLGRQRTTLVDALVRATAEVATEADGSLSGPVANQVRETFVAALATAPAAEAVSSGQLTRALSYAGFGDVDLSDATAGPSPARRPALRVIAGEGRGSGKSPVKGSQKGGGKGGGKTAPPEPEPEVEEVPAEPDPALLERLKVAEKRSRETMSVAAKAGDALSEATEALEALDARIAELEDSLKQARVERPGLASARNDAATANKSAERTLRAALAEVDQIRQQLPDDNG
jgi:hypothetical protein